MNPEESARTRRALFALCALGLAPFLYAFGFCYPRGDDFDRATRAMFFLDLPGALYEMGREWLSWSGRFSHHFLTVFFGSAADNRLLYGLVCLAVLVFFYSAIRASLAPFFRAPTDWLYAALSLLALCAFYQNLPDFYLLTDSLSIVAQEAAFLLFLAFFGATLRALKSGKDAAPPYRRTCCAAIFAVGLYEHAAFAVAWTLAGALLLVLPSRPDLTAAAVRLLKKLYFFIFLALAVALLAPGNGRRAMIRSVAPDVRWERLWGAPAEWMDALVAFLGAGFAGVLFLAAFMAFRPAPARIPFRAPLAASLAFAGFSLSIVFAQAAGDAPFSSSPKFNASLGFYAAVCEFFLVFWAIGRIANRWPALFAGAKLAAIKGCLFCLFAAAVVFSGNFAKTALNALSGEMALLGDFMEVRARYLASRSRSGLWPERGLIGEIRNPAARGAKINPDYAPVVVRSAFFSAFPVYTRDALGEEPGSWPNPSAAWASEVVAARASKPDEAAILAEARRGEGLRLTVPAELAYVADATLVSFAGENITFAGSWLVLELTDAAPEKLKVLQPLPVFSGRPVPAFLQEKWALELLARAKTEPSLLTALAAREIAASRSGARTLAIPLRAAGNGLIWPDVLFLGSPGSLYYRLRPWL